MSQLSPRLQPPPQEQQYVSCIRIDGIPIIGPVMTEQRRSEMRAYRDLAVARELELRKKKLFHSPSPVPSQSFDMCVTSVPCSEDNSNATLPEAAADSDRPLQATKPDEQMSTDLSCFVQGFNVTQLEDTTLHPDNNTSNSNETVLHESDISFQSCASKYLELPSGYTSDESTYQSNTNRCSSNSTAVNDDYTTDASIFNSFADGKSFNSVSMTSLTTSRLDDSVFPRDSRHSHDDSFVRVPLETKPSLIRSNSYTIDSPSPMFLKHLQEKHISQENQASGEKQDQENNEKFRTPSVPAAVVRTKSVESNSGTGKKVKTVSAPKATDSKTGFSKKRKTLERVYGQKFYQHPSATSSFPPKTSASTHKKPTPVQVVNGLSLEGLKVGPVEKINVHPPNCKGESRHNANTKPAAAVPEPPASIPTPVEVKTTTLVREPSRVTSNENRIIEMIQQMEIDRKRQMDELISRQEFEQRRLQEEFMQQQQLLVRQITERCTSMMNTCQQNVTSQLQEVITAVSPASRRPSQSSGGGGDWTDTKVAWSEVTLGSADMSVAKSSVGFARRLFDAQPPPVDDGGRTARAATKINALARGFLTRRLFATEDVQTIVKVIRDTLLFVIDLHLESNQHVEEDVQLKRSLLKQLNSACNMLHDIFFVKTTAQRMEIISTDRRIQRRKLLQSKAMQDRRNANNASPFRSSDTKCLSKLTKIVLFPIDIKAAMSATQSDIALKSSRHEMPKRSQSADVIWQHSDGWQ